jgi:enoyl-CoA hydratase/carnithine racemase
MHFFSPANVMKLLEVVRGKATGAAELATVMALAVKIGKVPVVSGVCHGFIGNRMLSRRQQQAHLLMLEGAAPADIDRVLTDFGFPMGPFQMSDLAGLDIGWNAETSKGESVRDRLCEAGTTVAMATEYLAELAANVSPTSIMVIKQQVYRQLMMPLGQAMDETNRAMDESVQRADFREGVRSFLEQRPPMFPRLGG